MRSPEIANHLANEGSVVVASAPEEYRALIRRETAKWQKIIQAGRDQTAVAGFVVPEPAPKAQA